MHLSVGRMRHRREKCWRLARRRLGWNSLPPAWAGGSEISKLSVAGPVGFPGSSGPGTTSADIGCENGHAVRSCSRNWAANSLLPLYFPCYPSLSNTGRCLSTPLVHSLIASHLSAQAGAFAGRSMISKTVRQPAFAAGGGGGPAVGRLRRSAAPAAKFRSGAGPWGEGGGGNPSCLGLPWIRKLDS